MRTTYPSAPNIEFAGLTGVSSTDAPARPSSPDVAATPASAGPAARPSSLERSARAAAAAAAPAATVRSAPLETPAVKTAGTDCLLVGLDLGTNATWIKACYQGTTELVLDETMPSMVGYAKEGVVQNLLPNNAKVLFGHVAVKFRNYLRMVPPLHNGVIDDTAAAADFAGHLGRLLNPPAGTAVRAVIGVPASADRAGREAILTTFAGVFDKILLIPEPFLAAMGFRDESRLADPEYLDPVRNSLFVDIGAGTTDVCLVQGYYPTAEDQVSVSFAGDDVDNLLMDSIRQEYPGVVLSVAKVRELKEQFSFVGTSDQPLLTSVLVGGKPRRLELTGLVESACRQLLQNIHDLVETAIARASSDMAGELMQNIILTGGGSRIRNLDRELQRMLTDDGYEKPRVLTVGENYKEYVAKGALVAARQAKPNQWQPTAA